MTNETKEKTKHTPLPWGLVEVEAIAGAKAIKAWQLISRDGKNTIASGLNVADGKKIAVAVAAHDELVAALKQMKIAMKNFLTLEGGIEKSAMEAADKAIAKAEGR